MCYGPIRVSWDHERKAEANPGLDDSLVLLLGLDIAEVSQTRPDVATENAYDFFFMTRKPVPAGAFKLYFFFPFPSRSTEAGSNNARRAKRMLRWHNMFLHTSLRSRGSESASSFGWNRDIVERLLPFDRPLGWYFQELAKTSFALNRVRVRRLRLPNAPEHDQHFVAEAKFKRELKPGQFLHISFKLKDAPASPGSSPRSGTAPLYYYNRLLHEQSKTYNSLNHPAVRAPVVPSVLLHTALYFPTKVTVTPDEFLPFRVSPHQPEPIESPSGRQFWEGRWFSIFNAHCLEEVGFDIKRFTIEWQYPKNTAPLTQDKESDYVKRAADRYVLLTARHREVLDQLSNGKTGKEIADALGMTPNTFYNHCSKIRAKLGLELHKLPDEVNWKSVALRARQLVNSE